MNTVQVRFRFNKLTGEVEEFQVLQESNLPAREHDRQHERLAAEIGRVVERDPRIEELHSGPVPTGQPPRTRPRQETEPAETQTAPKPKQTQAP